MNYNQNMQIKYNRGEMLNYKLSRVILLQIKLKKC